MFSESSTGSWAELQLPCCPSKQGELPENMLQNLFLNLPPQTVSKSENFLGYLQICDGDLHVLETPDLEVPRDAPVPLEVPVVHRLPRSQELALPVGKVDVLLNLSQIF